MLSDLTDLETETTVSGVLLLNRRLKSRAASKSMQEPKMIGLCRFATAKKALKYILGHQYQAYRVLRLRKEQNSLLKGTTIRSLPKREAAINPFKSPNLGWVVPFGF